MLLNWVVGPTIKPLEASDRMLPKEYEVANGTQFPARHCTRHSGGRAVHDTVHDTVGLRRCMTRHGVWGGDSAKLGESLHVS